MIHRVHWDTETYRVGPGRQCPPPVCIQWLPIHDDRVEQPQLLPRKDSVDVFRWLVEGGDWPIVGLNVAYDVLVMAEEWYRRGESRQRIWSTLFEKLLFPGRLICTDTRQRLLAVARGLPDGHPAKLSSMEAQVRHYFRVDLGDDKKGIASYRLRYSELDGIPVEQWPPEALRYALDDVLWDSAIYDKQGDVAEGIFGHREIPDEKARSIAKLVLHLSSARGLRSDHEAAQAANDSLTESIMGLKDALVDAGLMRRKIIHAGKPQQRVENTLNTFAIKQRIVDIFAEEGLEPPLTETGYKLQAQGLDTTAGVKRDKEVMNHPAISVDPALEILVAHERETKLRSTYVVPLCEDCGEPSDTWAGVQTAIHWRTDSLRDTGRVSTGKSRYSDIIADELVQRTSGNNVQNYPTHDALLGSAAEVLKHLVKVPAWLWTDRELQELGELYATAMPMDAPRRWAERHNVRGMVIARKNYCLLNRDYSMIEMCALAECQIDHFGFIVSLAQAINEGKDVHLLVGVLVHPLLHHGETLTYEQLVAEHKGFKKAEKQKRAPTALQMRVNETRKMCKVVNFGFLGGMGAKTFVYYVWQRLRHRIDEDLAKQMKWAWYDTFPEMRDWFYFIGDEVNANRPVIQTGSGRWRGNCTYTQNANTRFQGLAADGALNALLLMWWHALVLTDSALFGSFPLVLEHDANLVEVPFFDPRSRPIEVGPHLARAQHLRSLGWWCTRGFRAHEMSKADERIQLAQAFPQSNGHLLPSEDRCLLMALERVLEADDELDRVMVQGMAYLIPHVVIRSEGSGPATAWEK